MKLELWAVVDDEQIAQASYARGFQGMRVSPAERAIWAAMSEASLERRWDPDVERATVAYVPDVIWKRMNDFADGGSFPRLRFRFTLESDEHAMRGVRIAPLSSKEVAA